MRRRFGGRVAALTALAVVAPVGIAAAASGSGDGAPGIGDPYYPLYGNGGYDVKHYGIDVGYDPATDTLTGTTKIRAKATERLNRFDLDLVLKASSVKVDGKSATFTQAPHELVVTPKDWVAKGHTMEITVKYAGVPSAVSVDGISPWIRTDDGAAAVGEPEIAAWWYPSNDHPRDKAKYDVLVTVPKDLEALGNGKLVSSKATGKKRTWHWREAKPMAPYLAFFVAGQFDITKGTTKSGLPWVNAVASNGGSEGEYAEKDLARTPEIIDWEQRQWGPYAFDAVGGVAPAADFGFALENQTRPVYTRGFWGGGSNIYVVVHENAHQWYGDSVSVNNWKDIWLNEGFASFTEWLWSEKHGDGTAKELFAQTYAGHPESDSFWSLKIGDPGKGKEFSGAVYDRGAMALQALRTRIGGPAFFTVMRNWAAQHRYGNGSVPQFVRLAEKVSGKDLGSFFDAWLYTGARPAATPANGFPKDFGADVAGAQRGKVPSTKALDRARTTLLAHEHQH